MNLKVETVSVEWLTFDSKNARKHSAENLAAIAESLKQFGQRKPIVVTADNVVVAGNGTLEAARLIGWSSIDVVRVPADWSDDQVKAFALADNRTAELAEWDSEVLLEQLFELEASGFDVDVMGFVGFAYTPESFDPVDEVPRLDEKEAKLCPNCGHSL